MNFQGAEMNEGNCCDFSSSPFECLKLARSLASASTLLTVTRCVHPHRSSRHHHRLLALHVNCAALPFPDPVLLARRPPQKRYTELTFGDGINCCVDHARLRMVLRQRGSRLDPPVQSRSILRSIIGPKCSSLSS